MFIITLKEYKVYFYLHTKKIYTLGQPNITKI